MTVVDMAYPGRFSTMAMLRERVAVLREKTDTDLFEDELATKNSAESAGTKRARSSLRLPPELGNKVYLDKADCFSCIR